MVTGSLVSEQTGFCQKGDYGRTAYGKKPGSPGKILFTGVLQSVLLISATIGWFYHFEGNCSVIRQLLWGLKLKWENIKHTHTKVAPDSGEPRALHVPRGGCGAEGQREALSRAPGTGGALRQPDDSGLLSCPRSGNGDRSGAPAQFGDTALQNPLSTARPSWLGPGGPGSHASPQSPFLLQHPHLEGHLG